MAFPAGALRLDDRRATIYRMKVMWWWLALAALAPAQSAVWTPFEWLAGRWTGEASGQPGQGSGWFAFTPDLQGGVLVRKSHSEYPAAGGRPAIIHDDLLVVYPEGGATRAIYFDNEGHVIRYGVQAGPRQIVFLSEASAWAPGYRLSYFRLDAGRIRVRFEIAPPGKPFATYLESVCRRE